MTKEEFNIKLGKFVKTKRELNKWSQQDLADKIGNNFQNISRLERGLTSPTLYWISNLADVFNQELDEFVREFKESSAN